MGSTCHNIAKAYGWWLILKALPKRSAEAAAEIAISMVNLAKDDPRRVIHSIKVGLALTLVSLFYYFQPLYDDFGVSAMWAVVTVVVVFEFSVGATLGKGLNRAMATLLAGVLGLGAYRLASLCGKIGEPLLIASFVFLQAAVSTFMRFFPNIKARYDYGFLIFMLTFCIVSITGYRQNEIWELAHKRLSTIVIGGFASLLVSIFVYPVWAGEDLHNLVALNVEKLGSFLEGFGIAYFNIPDELAKDDKSFLRGYRSVLNSKNIEEALANFARWEPAHGQYRFGHPWKKYLEVGALIRQCAYRIDALNGYLVPDIQATVETSEEIREACVKMSLESGAVLKELASALRAMTQSPTSVDARLASSKAAAKSLKLPLLGSASWEDVELVKVIPLATVASLLMDTVDCTEKIAAAFHDLASQAHFKKIEHSPLSDKSQTAFQTASENQISSSRDDCPHAVILLGEITPVTNTVNGDSIEALSGQHV
ncbi:hypothetical protein Nepgr_000249 [Nepenthes gracilis]|uniref:Aluminum-activated malate transporter n=1 Tax=Nepenthes gracilis TaxID=150966 RepID=A0AAD3P1M5_NEPGR|nr:hypothetical protein Nepgr_000249 [Nepenthes gracilis]